MVTRQSRCPASRPRRNSQVSETPTATPARPGSRRDSARPSDARASSGPRWPMRTGPDLPTTTSSDNFESHVASQVESGEARENRFVSRIRPVFRTRRTPISSAPRPAGTIDGVDGRGAKACGGRASHTCDKRHTVTASRLARVLICSCQISLRAPRTLSMPAPSAATQAASRPKTRDSRPRRNRALRRPVAS